MTKKLRMLPLENRFGSNPFLGKNRKENCPNEKRNRREDKSRTFVETRSGEFDADLHLQKGLHCSVPTMIR